MNVQAVMRIAAVLILAGIFCMAPVLAAEPVLISTFTGKIGIADGFMPGKLSALSDAKSLVAGMGKSEIISGISGSLQPAIDLSSYKNTPIEWDPKFMYYAERNANIIPRCHF